MTYWTIPTQDVQTIYRIESFEFKSNYSIKTTKKTISLNSDHEDLFLFLKVALKIQKEKYYKYLHIRIVQIALKPLFRLGLDVPVFIYLRDAYLLKTLC